MAKKPAKKSAKPMNKKQMKKTTGGFFAYSGGLNVAAGDVNGDNVAINGGTLNLPAAGGAKPGKLV